MPCRPLSSIMQDNRRRRSPPKSVRNCSDHFPEALARLGAPTPNDQKIVRGIDVYIIATAAQSPIRILWRAGPLPLFCIEPPQKTVVWAVGARCGRHLYI